MMLTNWLTNRLKTDFTQKEILVRIAADLFLSNLGLFLGILTTVGIGIFTWNITPQAFFREMFFKVWLVNIPALTVCCLFAYAVNGLYDGTWSRPYMSRMLAISRAVVTAFCLFLLWIYITRPLMPRSTMIAGWLFIFVLILSARLFWASFTRQYRLVPIRSDDIRVQKLVRDLDIISHQDGWVPPEDLPERAAWPYFDDDEILAAAAVLRSGKINQWTGEEVEQFQQEFAAFCGVRHAIALTNGSVALDLALYALNIGPGDEVIVTSRSFVASAGCVALRGAKPVFADVHPDSQNITPESIQKAITPQTRAIVAVHLAGWPCDMDPIIEIAGEYRLKVIEDCAQCHGGVYYSRWPGRMNHGAPIERDGVRLYPRPTGSLGHMAAFSFCQDKIMTTGGEGGMLLTDDDALWEKVWAFKDHGKSYDSVYRRLHPPGFRWLHESFGTNGRMTEMQAAIGRRQLQKLPDWLAARRRNAAILTEAFSCISGLRVTIPPETVRHAYYKYYVFVRPEHLKVGWDRERIMNAVIAEGVPCFSGTCSEIYLEKAFDGSGLRPVERLPVARDLGDTSLMFLVHPTLTEKDMESIAVAVIKVMAEAGC
ncbi:MAG: aminotransferase class I/II-fold pyridoxal phosphate-dependent enzyme [Syntrophales bacterium]